MKATAKVLEINALPEKTLEDGTKLPMVKSLRLSVLAQNPFARPEIHWVTVPMDHPVTKDETFEIETTEFLGKMKETKLGRVISTIRVQAFRYS